MKIRYNKSALAMRRLKLVMSKEIIMGIKNNNLNITDIANELEITETELLICLNETYASYSFYDQTLICVEKLSNKKRGKGARV